MHFYSALSLFCQFFLVWNFILIIVIVTVDNNNNHHQACTVVTVSAAAPVFTPGAPTYYKIDPLTTQSPRQVVYDPNTDLFFIAVAGANRIYSFDASTSTFTHIAGTGAAGVTDEFIGTNALMDSPTGITLNVDSTSAPKGYFFTDPTNHCIRKVRETSPYSVSQACGSCGNVGISTGGCGGFPAKLKSPADFHLGLKIWAVADRGSHTIAVLAFTTGNNRDKQLLAGTYDTAGSADGLATSATFNEPYSVALFPRDSATPQALFISEHGAARLRRLIAVSNTGTVSTIFDHGAANKGWGLDHRASSATQGELLWWNDFNGLYHFDMTISDAALPPASIPNTYVGVQCGITDLVWPATFTNFAIFGTRNSATTTGTDYDMFTYGTTCVSYSSTTTTTSTTTVTSSTTTTDAATSTTVPAPTVLPPPVPGVVYVDDVVALRPDCSAAATRCPSKYSSSESCVCPKETAAVNITLVDVGAVDTNLDVATASSQSCGSGRVVIGLCSKPASVGSSSASAFITTDADDNTNNNFCLQPNPETGDCSCPENRTLAFPLPAPALVSNTSGSNIFEQQTRVTFCMPLGQAVFWTPNGNRNNRAESSSSSCLHPLGENYTCTCRGSSSGVNAKRVPAAVFNGTDLLNSGALTFCGSDLETRAPAPLPPLVSPAVSTATVAVTVLGSISGGNLAVVQAAAIMLSICPQRGQEGGDDASNSSSSSSNSMVTFAEIEGVGEAKGWAFMLMLGLAIPGLHALVVTLWSLVRLCFGTTIKNYEHAPEDRVVEKKKGITDDVGSAIDADLVSDIDIIVKDTADTNASSFTAQWQAAALQLKFPHFSMYLTNLVFAGFASESAILVAKGGGKNFPGASAFDSFDNIQPVYLALGVLGLILCVCYIVAVGSVCHTRKKQQLEDDKTNQRKLKNERDRRQEALLFYVLERHNEEVGSEQSRSVCSSFLATPQAQHHVLIDNNSRNSNNSDNNRSSNENTNSSGSKSGDATIVSVSDNNIHHDERVEQQQQQQHQQPCSLLARVDTLRPSQSASLSLTKALTDGAIDAKKNPDEDAAAGAVQDHEKDTPSSHSLPKVATAVFDHQDEAQQHHEARTADDNNHHQHRFDAASTPSSSRSLSVVSVTTPRQGHVSGIVLGGQSAERDRHQHHHRFDDHSGSSAVALTESWKKHSGLHHHGNGMHVIYQKSPQSQVLSPGQLNLDPLPSSKNINNNNNNNNNNNSDDNDNDGSNNSGAQESVKLGVLRSPALLLSPRSQPFRREIGFEDIGIVLDEQTGDKTDEEEQELVVKNDSLSSQRSSGAASGAAVDVNIIRHHRQSKRRSTLSSRKNKYEIIDEECGTNDINADRSSAPPKKLSMMKHCGLSMQDLRAFSRKIANNRPVSAQGEQQNQENGKQLSNSGGTNSKHDESEELERNINTDKFWPPPIYTRLTSGERSCGCCEIDEDALVEDGNDEDPEDRSRSARQTEILNAKRTCCASFSRSFFGFFSPRGLWFADERNFNRRFGALFFLYTPSGAAWAPIATLLFLFLVAIVSALSGCDVPLHTLGGLHALIAILFVWKQPANVPFDNLLLILQYFAGAALAFSRGLEYKQSLVFFTCILVIAIVSVVHALFQYVLEECVLVPKKKLVFRTMDEEEDRILSEIEGGI